MALTVRQVATNFVHSKKDNILKWVSKNTFDEELAINVVTDEINRIGINQFNEIGQKNKFLAHRWINYLFGAIFVATSEKTDQKREDAAKNTKNNPDTMGFRTFFGGGFPSPYPDAENVDFNKVTKFLLAQHKVALQQDAKTKPFDNTAAENIIESELNKIGHKRWAYISHNPEKLCNFEEYLKNAIYFRMKFYEHEL